MRFVIDPDSFNNVRVSPLFSGMFELMDLFNLEYDELEEEINQDSKITIFISYKRGDLETDLGFVQK